MVALVKRIQALTSYDKYLFLKKKKTRGIINIRMMTNINLGEFLVSVTTRSNRIGVMEWSRVGGCPVSYQRSL